MTASGIHVRDKFTLERRNHVLKYKSTLLESSNPELVDHGIMRQRVDQVVEVAVRDAQFPQLFKLLEGLGVDFAAHCQRVPDCQSADFSKTETG